MTGGAAPGTVTNGDGRGAADGGGAGVEGNRRLTGTTGMLLLVLLAVEGVTVLRVRQLIVLHVYLGVLLVGPVLLKSASTVYRFARYYTGAAAYVRKGPPHVVLRALGPAVVLSSLTLLGSGIAVILQAGGGGAWLTLHKVSFFVWFAVMAVHVLGHLGEALLASFAELSSASRGRRARLALLVASLVAGVALASALYPSASSWTTGDHRHDGRRAVGAHAHP